MDHCRLVAFLLLCSQILFAGAILNGVDYPDTLEGMRYTLETGASTFFAIDFTRQRFLFAENPGGPSFSLVDFRTGVLHRFTHGICSTVLFPDANTFQQHVQDNFGLPDLPLGELLHPLEITATGNRVGNVDRVSFNTKTGDVHIPFFLQETNDDETVRTVFYYNLSTTLGRASSDINSDVSVCVHENWSGK